MKDRPITLVTSTPTWYGGHSGYYERLVEALRQRRPIRVMRPPRGRAGRVFGKAYAMLKGLPSRDQRLTVVEARGRLAVERDPAAIVHVTNLDGHLPILRHWSSAPRNLIGTIHFPPSVWNQDDLDLLRRCNSAILLYQKDLEFFEEHVGKGRVKAIPHGVDVDFFRPAPAPREGPARILFCGQFLRDFAMLGGVVERVQAAAPDVEFDLVIAHHVWGRQDLAALHNKPGVRWHAGLSDEQLLNVFWKAGVAIFPFRDTAANNAIVECLACGVPIVATDVGGIRDYGGGRFFPVVPCGDADAMTAEVLRLLEDSAGWASVSAAQRVFAETTLAWPITAEQHLQAYESLMS